MIRPGIFGWSYPPGAASDPNAPYNQTDDGPCAVCARSADQCECPECGVCGETGNPNCYLDTSRKEHVHRLGHGMRLSRAQVVGRAEAYVARMRDLASDAEMAAEHLREGEYSCDLADNPDPWR